MIDLRGYQEEGVDAIRASYAAGNRRVLYVLPTGGGKTYTFSYIADRAAKKKHRVCILVHRQELLFQAACSLASLGIPHRLVAATATIRACLSLEAELFGRSFIDQDSPITVASVQTLVRRLDSAPDFTLIIPDEAHHGVAGSWAKIAARYQSAKFLGVTATPIRLDGKGLDTAFDDLVVGPTISKLIEDGYLTDAKIYAPAEAPDLTGIRKGKGDYAQGALAERMNATKITGDAIKHYRTYGRGMPALAFCVSVAHAQQVAEDFRFAGLRAAAVDGKMDRLERARLIADLGAGRLDVLSSCDIISEGTDIPRVGVAILLRPTQSEGLFLQQCGRVLRPYEGKEFAVILDHAGNTHKHGIPTLDREWSLEHGIAPKTRDGPAAEPVSQCGVCFALFRPAPVCPECGAVMAKPQQIEQVDEDLVEVDVEAAKRNRRAEQSNAGSLEDLIALGKSRGYRNATRWAGHIWNARKSGRARAA